MSEHRIFECMTEECENWAAVWITLDGHNKHVCHACRDEMVELHGWALLDWGSTQ